MVVKDATHAEKRKSERRYRLWSDEEYGNPIIEEVNAPFIYARPYFNLANYTEPCSSIVIDSIHARYSASTNFGRVSEAYFEKGISPDKTKELFNNLAGEWKAATAFSSSATDMAMHPAYQQIIGMGRDVVPLILRKLQKNTDHWFWGLKSITGMDPVPSEDRGNISKMREAWIVWGQENDLI